MHCLFVHALLNIPYRCSPGQELGTQPPLCSWLQAPRTLLKAGGFARAPSTTMRSIWHRAKYINSEIAQYSRACTDASESGGSRRSVCQADELTRRAELSGLAKGSCRLHVLGAKLDVTFHLRLLGCLICKFKKNKSLYCNSDVALGIALDGVMSMACSLGCFVATKARLLTLDVSALSLFTQHDLITGCQFSQSYMLLIHFLQTAGHSFHSATRTKQCLNLKLKARLKASFFFIQQ